MDNEQDVFSQGWSDGGVVSDEREAEALPQEDGQETPLDGSSEPDGAPTADRDGQIERFVREFPHVRGRDIPREVWEEVRGGRSLTEAYLLSERSRLREENAHLRAAFARRELNSARSAGSQAGLGFGETKTDAFEEGWDVK